MAKQWGVKDQMVCRQDNHDVIRGSVLNIESREAYAGGGVSAHRLNKDVSLGNPGQLPHQFFRMTPTCDDQDILR